LAAALRFYRLDAQSFWHDEGNSVRIAERSIKLILEGAAGDIHPPLYYLALHFWRSLVGQSEFALRAFSVVVGVGLVGLTFALGLRFFSRPAALIAALLAAVNPFQVYYSQEARSYIWVAFLVAAAIYCGHRFLDARGGGARSKTPWAVGYTLAVTAGLYTHYIFPLALIAINLIALFQLLPAIRDAGARSRALNSLGSWLLLHLIAALFYLPWLPIAIRQLVGWPSAPGQVALWPALIDTFRLLSLGITVQTADVGFSLLGFGFILLLGLIPGIPGRRPGVLDFVLTLLWLVVPVALVFAFNLYKDAFLKFMLVVSPAFCLLLGRGLVRGLMLDSRTSSSSQSPPLAVPRSPVLLPTALGLGLMISFSYESLVNLYFDPNYARADYRGMARAIESVARPGDGVILNAANQWEVFTYYYPHVERVYPLPRHRPVREPEVVAELEGIAANHDRLFAIFWAEAESDPERVVERWLDAHTYKADDQWWKDVRLVTYAVPAAPSAEMDTRVDARLGDTIMLHGYTLLEDHLAPADIIQVTLFWEASASITQRYKVFLHLLDGDGTLVAQRDSEPGGGLALTTTWEPGQIQTDNHGILIPVGTPPGTYQLTAGLYPLEDPVARLPVTLDGEPAGDVLSLALITVSTP
jgi:hypothetical protein